MTELAEHDPRDVTGAPWRVDRWTLKTGNPAQKVISGTDHPLSPEILGPAVTSDGALWRGQPPAG
jgi:hypothetical protein